MKLTQKFVLLLMLICAFNSYSYEEFEMNKMFDPSAYRSDYESNLGPMSEEMKALLLLDKVPLALHSANPLKKIEELSCNCRFANSENTMAYETPQSCLVDKINEKGEAIKDESGQNLKVDRYYLKGDIDKVKSIDTEGLFWKPRGVENKKNFNEILPKKCTMYAMRRIMEILPSSSFAKCDSNQAFPTSAGAKPCVTSEYFNIVHNSLNDVSDCFGLNLRESFPKLMNESGLHTNTWSFIKIKKYKVGGCLRDSKSNKIVSINERLLTPAGDLLKEKRLYWSESEKKTKEINVLLDQEKAMKIYTDQENENQKLISQNKCPKFQYHRIGGDAGIGQFTSSAIEGIKGQLEKELTAMNSQNKSSCQRLSKYLAKADLQLPLSANLDNRCNMVSMPTNPFLSLIAYAVKHKVTEKEVNIFWDRLGIDAELADLGATNFNKEKMKSQLEMLSYNAGSGTAVILFKNWLKYRKQFPSSKLNLKDFDFSYRNVNPVPFIGKKMTVSDLNPQQANGVLAEIKKLKDSNSNPSRLQQLEALDLNKLNFGSFMMVYRTENRMARAYLYGVKQFANELDKELGQGTCTEKSYLAL